MVTEEVPEPWAARMVERGFTRPDGAANISALARAAGVAIETARRLVHGKGDPDPRTVAKFVDALGDDVQTWLGKDVSRGLWTPPAESALLDDKERDALDQLVRVMARTKASASDQKDATVTPIERAPRKRPGGLSGRKIEESQRIAKKSARHDQKTDS